MKFWADRGRRGFLDEYFGLKKVISMKNRASKLVLLSLALALTALQPAQAQNQQIAEWEKASEAGKAALKAGKFAEAEKQFKAAQAALQALPANDSRRTDTLNSFAELYTKQNKFAEAESSYKQAVALAEKAIGEQNGASNLASCLNNLAALYFKQDKFAEAEALMLKAVATEEKALGPTSKGLITGLTNLADLYKQQGKIDQAVAVNKRIIGIWEKNAPDSVQLGMALDAFAGFYRNLKQYEESEEPEKRALAILEKKCGAESAQVAACLSNLGTTYKSQNKFDEAEAVLKRALAINEKLHGANNQETAKACRNLAKMYKTAARYPESESFYKKAIAIDEAAADKGEQIKDLESYADLLRKAGRDEDAEEIDAKVEALRSGAKEGAGKAEASTK